ncbi:hypothetical protein KY328_00755, partial [Candidatus Woesearchaeota archaeon]|nr:hypothetical protein [Candidatus Woesearchaeota archaeon]
MSYNKKYISFLKKADPLGWTPEHVLRDLPAGQKFMSYLRDSTVSRSDDDTQYLNASLQADAIKAGKLHPDDLKV